jgi:hypothetical protein
MWLWMLMLMLMVMVMLVFVLVLAIDSFGAGAGAGVSASGSAVLLLAPCVDACICTVLFVLWSCSKLPAWKRDMVLQKRAQEASQDPNTSTVFPGSHP